MDDLLTPDEAERYSRRPWGGPLSRATRVEVRAPQGSTYDGKRGTVIHAAPGFVLVALDGIATIPFGHGELIALAGGLLVLS